MKKTDWISTYSGIKFYPLEPELETISIVDIAHALSMNCRFSGHTKDFYSVAEHCCHIYDLCSDENKLEALLHDASEAYLVDMPKPLKPFLKEFTIFEDRLQELIYEAFYIQPEKHEVKFWDTRMLYTEANALLMNGTKDWAETSNGYDHLDIEISCWSPKIAEKEFLDRYYYTSW